MCIQPLSFANYEFYNRKPNPSNRDEIIIYDEYELLKINSTKNQDYIILEPVITRAICSLCGKNGLNIATIYTEYDFKSISCPNGGWPTGGCILTHYKVYDGVRCNYCGFEGERLTFLYDKVKSECFEPVLLLSRWVKPNITHSQGYDTHECPASCCLDVYSKFSIVAYEDVINVFTVRNENKERIFRFLNLVESKMYSFHIEPYIKPTQIVSSINAEYEEVLINTAIDLSNVTVNKNISNKIETFKDVAESSNCEALIWHTSDKNRIMFFQLLSR